MNYAQIDNTGLVVAVLTTDKDMTGVAGMIEAPEDIIGKRWDGTAFVDVPPAPATPVRILTRRQFRQRLTLAEQLIVDNFDVAEYAAGHPKISALTVDQRALVRVALGNYRDVAEVNLDDPDTVQFVGLFGQLGLWDSPERAQAILS